MVTFRRSKIKPRSAYADKVMIDGISTVFSAYDTLSDFFQCWSPGPRGRIELQSNKLSIYREGHPYGFKLIGKFHLGCVAHAVLVARIETLIGQLEVNVGDRHVASIASVGEYIVPLPLVSDTIIVTFALSNNPSAVVCFSQLWLMMASLRSEWVKND